ncbi:pectate lyase domain-containing protein [Ditylenchus destructor]|uniref:Probable pectate lyase F n=1 Tax=Ditylenchus destructor TaxID=166010 RepID=A0AAD4ML29_9BILA|nr:pectate lyase domain-containing protein [Ditylenchus destructor]
MMVCGLIFFFALFCVHLSVAQFPAWPTPSTTIKVAATIKINSTNSPFDGKNNRYIADFDNDDGSQNETQPRIFEMADGTTIKNVVIGAPAADGIRCRGSCTIDSVWWEDVGEDAATFYGNTSATYLVTSGGAKKAEDKVFQHDGGGTLTIKNFQVEDFGKLYRTCGTCANNSPNLPRHCIIDTIRATGPGRWIAGVNSNYGDSVTLKNIQIVGAVKKICAYYEGNNNGNDNPPILGNFGPTEDGDGKYCIYKKSDIKSTNATSS